MRGRTEFVCFRGTPGGGFDRCQVGHSDRHLSTHRRVYCAQIVDQERKDVPGFAEKG